MKKYCRYMIRPGSSIVEVFYFDNFNQAHRFESSKLFEGWTGVAGPDYPWVVDVPGYEQLRLFDL